MVPSIVPMPLLYVEAVPGIVVVVGLVVVVLAPPVLSVVEVVVVPVVAVVIVVEPLVSVVVAVLVVVVTVGEEELLPWPQPPTANAEIPITKIQTPNIMYSFCTLVMIVALRKRESRGLVKFFLLSAREVRVTEINYCSTAYLRSKFALS